ncbi:glucan biosynthesis protein [Kushneria sinocarnis]|nr:glucan biosynthesis protein D [Kushneria sinocarnis]
MDRRTLLKASMALSALGMTPAAFTARADSQAPGEGVDIALDDQAQSFSHDWLKQHAREMARSAYQDRTEKLPETLASLDPHHYSNISYDRNHALWSDDADADVQVQFFHVGMHFNQPVRMYSVNDGRAREIHFNPELFKYNGSGVDTGQLEGQDLGFAGFRVSRSPDFSALANVVAFLGASYFRAIDKNDQFGLSARGLAIDTAMPPDEGSEEFPAFTHFWFEHPDPNRAQLTVYALLDSPSTTGAYRFDIDCQAERVVMSVDAHVYPRKPIRRLGISPMTSMFLTGPSQQSSRNTVVEQVHDSDRLSMWLDDGEWICRPLYNPKHLQYNAFSAGSPRGFGLVQDDHEFEHYRDTVNWYSNRPSLWCEPTSDWGDGSIVLVELPTMGETVDNIVAFWQPQQPVQAGDDLHYAYRLYWSPRPPYQPSLSQVDKTFSGIGGSKPGWIPGEHPPETWARRFAVDFRGEPLASMPPDATVKAEILASHGRTEVVSIGKLGPLDQWRVQFDWYPDSESTEPVTLRLYLHQQEQTLSETWLYQWVPPQPSDRNWERNDR